MIAKLICKGSTRHEARERLSQALKDTIIRGTSTNLEYLQTIVDCKGALRVCLGFSPSPPPCSPRSSYWGRPLLSPNRAR